MSAASLKAAVIGAGSTYTPELIDGLLRRSAALPIRTLALVDPDERRLGVLAGFVARMCEATDYEVVVEPTTDLLDGVRDAAFVFSQFRVGGQSARHGDEELGRRWGIVGQETTGVGGLAKGLRTIPVALAVQAAVAEVARPDAWLVNFTNPAGMVTEALLRHGVGDPPRVLGLCNFPWTLRAQLAAAFGVPAHEVDLDYVGLNHLAWIRDVAVEGRPSMAPARKAWREGPDAPFERQLLDDVGLILNPYLQYYYETARILHKQTCAPTRASDVAALETDLLDRYADTTTTWHPSMLAARGGASYSEAAAALAADLHAGPGGRHVVNVLNAGALPGLPADAVVETTCQVDGEGAVPRPTAPLAGPTAGLAAQVKDYERYAIDAAVSGDHRAARLALLTHPLCPDATATDGLLEDLLATNRQWLPAFA